MLYISTIYDLYSKHSNIANNCDINLLINFVKDHILIKEKHLVIPLRLLQEIIL